MKRKVVVTLAMSCLSIPLSARNNSEATGQIYMKVDIRLFFVNLSKRLKLHYHLKRVKCILHEDQSIFITRSFLLIMRNSSDTLCTVNESTNFVFNNFFSENLTVYEIMWENNVGPERPQMTIWRMRIVCWVN